MEKAKLLMLIAAAKDAAGNAYAPYSNYQVGAAVLGESGKVYTGCNIENASYGLTICAERVAVQKAVSGGEKRIAAVAISGATSEIPRPCGACLQVMREFASEDNEVDIVSCSNNGEYDVQFLADYLPMPFKLEK